jgi:hypothetical protein
MALSTLQQSRPIASDSARLLRQAKSAKARGFSNEVVNSLAMAGYQAKENEPRGSVEKEDAQAQKDLVASQGFAKVQAAKQAADENLKGRISFADELKQRAGGSQPEGFDLRSFAEPRAAQLGISQGALTSFFQKNNLPMTNVAATTTPSGGTNSLGNSGVPGSSAMGSIVKIKDLPNGTGTNSLGNSGVPGSSAVPLKSQAEIESEKKKKATPNYGGTYGSSGYYQ